MWLGPTLYTWNLTVASAEIPDPNSLWDVARDYQEGALYVRERMESCGATLSCPLTLPMSHAGLSGQVLPGPGVQLPSLSL